MTFGLLYFSVKSAYDSFARSVQLLANPLFWLIWKWKGMERIMVFLWQVAIDALPTSFFHFSRHITADPCYPCCKSNLHETSLHGLRDCEFMAKFWRHLVDANLFPQFYILPIRSWLLWNLSPFNPTAERGWGQVLSLPFIISGALEIKRYLSFLLLLLMLCLTDFGLFSRISRIIP